MPLPWQPSLLAADPPGFDPGLAGLARRDLGSGAWCDTCPAWVRGADALFAAVVEAAPWAEHERPMYDRVVVEPRLTTRRWDDPPPPVAAMAEALSHHYGTDLTTVSANLYRDGRDSVAWHGDRVGRRRSQATVAIVSLGAARRFLLRPVGGGPSVRLTPAAGDLLVLGGTCQRTWQHCVPKCASAGPRVSLMFREDY
ncbi:MAG TPA: alpha-ketoglutarate-dependent dioxygenase AlkB [Acidimicrobiales bacterium]|nr:alpha-ketoglutarate-dependent dioxygenase AlkB [Acidimicrobiales bacterium]